MSEEPTAPHVEVALNQCVQDLAEQGIAKAGFNSFHKFYFRGIDDVYGALSPVLANNKLNCKPRMIERKVEKLVTGTGNSQKTQLWTAVHMEYCFSSAVDGSETKVEMWGEAMDTADKGTNKAVSAAYKYMAFQTFCIPVAGDDDADASAPEPPASSKQSGNKQSGNKQSGSKSNSGSKQPLPPMTASEIDAVEKLVEDADTDLKVRAAGAKVFAAKGRMPDEKHASLAQSVLVIRGKLIAVGAIDNFESMVKAFVEQKTVDAVAGEAILKDAKSRLNLPLE